jgi:hypothetical protein
MAETVGGAALTVLARRVRLFGLPFCAKPSAGQPASKKDKPKTMSNFCFTLLISTFLSEVV